MHDQQASQATRADHDQPYRFGRKPTASAPFPFTARQFGRLLVLRGRVQDGLCTEHLTSALEPAA